MRKNRLLQLILALFCSVLLLAGCATAGPSTPDEGSASGSAPATQAAPATDGEGSDEPADTATQPISYEGYKLEQVTVLSRHNIRAPLSSKGSVLDTMTPHEWISWTSDASELSLRGGVLEVEMGQYFRKWLEGEGLFPEDYMPTDDEVRIYANTKQRTIATARFFQAGLLPVDNGDVEHADEFNAMDPVFLPGITFTSEDYEQKVRAQVDELYGPAMAQLSDEYELLSDVLDVEESEAWKDGSFTGFVTNDMELVLEVGDEPKMNGSLKTATSLADALVLQYYESDDATAAFGKELTDEQWEAIARIKDVYGEVLFSTPLLAVNVAHPLLQELDAEMHTQGRVFSFLCGHDSNIASVTAALRVEPYELPDAIEKTTPIGCKLVFSRWSNEAGENFVSVDLVYQTVDQLRYLTILDADQSPAHVRLSLEGLTPNADGLYPAEQVDARFHEAIDAYDTLGQ